jgi:hypothetical protein
LVQFNLIRNLWQVFHSVPHRNAGCAQAVAAAPVNGGLLRARFNVKNGDLSVKNGGVKSRNHWGNIAYGENIQISPFYSPDIPLNFPIRLWYLHQFPLPTPHFWQLQVRHF